MASLDEFFGTQEESGRRTAEWLLVESLADLRHRSRQGATRYEQLGISAILRRLLTDKHPVLAKARARLSLPEPVYRFTPVPPPSNSVSGSMVLALSLGSIWADTPSTSAGLEVLLAASTGYSHPSAVTVLDVIRYFSHVYGGVHLGVPSSDFEAVAQRIFGALPTLTSGYMDTLVGISMVVVDALSPIAFAIESNPYPVPPDDVDIDVARQLLLGIPPTEIAD